MKNKSADGLRGLAAFNVVIAHFVAAFVPSMLHSSYPTLFNSNPNPSTLFGILTSPIFAIFYNGHFAVLIFFVLSGYVLALPYHASSTDPIPLLQRRLWGRYLRLNLPILVAVSISYCIYSAGWYFNVKASEISGSTNWLGNFFPQGISVFEAAREAAYQSILFGKGTLIPPLWTLKVEFIGSLYLLLFFISKPRGYTLMPLLLLFPLIHAVHGQESIYFYAIFLGSLLGTVKSLPASRLALFVLGLYFGGFQFESLMYDGLPAISFRGNEIYDKKTFYNAIGALSLTASVVHGFGSGLLQGRLAQFLGRVSFSLYLIHFIVLCSFSSFLYIRLPRDTMNLAANLVGYLALCLLASMLFEKVVDRASIQISHGFSAILFKQASPDAKEE